MVLSNDGGKSRQPSLDRDDFIPVEMTAKAFDNNEETMEANDHTHTFEDGGDKRDPRTFLQLVRELLGTLLFLQQVHNSWLLLIRTMRKLKERSHLANLMDLLMTKVLMSQSLLLQRR